MRYLITDIIRLARRIRARREGKRQARDILAAIEAHRAARYFNGGQ